MSELENADKVIKGIPSLHIAEPDKEDIETLRKFINFLQEHKRNPSVRELATLIEVGTSAAYNRLQKLENFGFLKNDGSRFTIVGVKIVVPETITEILEE